MILQVFFLFIILVILYQITQYEEGFTVTKDKSNKPEESSAKTPVCPQSNCPDLSKYVLKSSIPPCPPKQDLSKYVLRSSVPPMPDMEKYVLKTSVPGCPACPACPKPEYTRNNCLTKCSEYYPKSTVILKPITIQPLKKIIVSKKHGNGTSHHHHPHTHNTHKQNTTPNKYNSRADIKKFYSNSPSDSFYFSGNHHANVGYESRNIL